MGRPEFSGKEPYYLASNIATARFTQFKKRVKTLNDVLVRFLNASRLFPCGNKNAMKRRWRKINVGR
jgi:hypothetical protein